MPPWFLAAALGQWRAGRGLECLEARAVSAPDSLLHPPATVGFHCLTASCLGFLFAGTSKRLEKTSCLCYIGRRGNVWSINWMAFYWMRAYHKTSELGERCACVMTQTTAAWGLVVLVLGALSHKPVNSVWLNPAWEEVWSVIPSVPSLSARLGGSCMSLPCSTAAWSDADSCSCPCSLSNERQTWPKHPLIRVVLRLLTQRRVLQIW